LDLPNLEEMLSHFELKRQKEWDHLSKPQWSWGTGPQFQSASIPR